MKKSMEKLMAKKESSMPEHEKSARMSVLHHMKQIAEDAMKGHMDRGMKKVSVMSNDKEGLAEGLDKAKQILGHSEDIAGDPLSDEAAAQPIHEDVNMPGDSSHDDHRFATRPSPHDAPDRPAMEGNPEHEVEEEPVDGDDLSPDELDAKIAHLMALRHSKSGK